VFLKISALAFFAADDAASISLLTLHGSEQCVNFFERSLSFHFSQIKGFRAMSATVWASVWVPIAKRLFRSETRWVFSLPCLFDFMLFPFFNLSLANFAGFGSTLLHIPVDFYVPLQILFPLWLLATRAVLGDPQLRFLQDLLHFR